MKIGKRRMNLLFVSTDLNIGSLIIRTINEGSNVKVYSSKYKHNALEGFLPDSKWVDNWKEHIDWADVIIFDDVGWGKHADRLRKKGKLVVGGSEYTDKLEVDRQFGQEELQKIGIKILDETEFSTIDKIINYIKKNPARYVLKPCGGHDSDGTIVAGSKDSSDLLILLEHNRKQWTKNNRYFLQKFVEGIEVAVGATFDGNDFVYPININFEYKRLFNGGLGPLTWEMGTVLFHTNKNKLFNETLLKMKERLRAASYIGDIDINCIVNSNGIFPLEFTCRFGFPTTQLLWEANTRNASNYFFHLARGMVKNKPPQKGYTVGALVCVPPFPFNDNNESEKYKGALIRFERNDLCGVHFVDSIKRKGQHIVNGSCPLIVCGKAGTVKEARKKMYARIDKIQIENKYYRTDIGEGLEKESKKLKELGYI
ncbi:phosphoribosylamine--glycine ligase [Candidatus Micrarchaeota archaeon]|nr:phosphoribosylamine--glycine ligase [Candidatus Micrarchaeota archaeon]